MSKNRQMTPEEARSVADLVARARVAQLAIENYTQAEVDTLVTAVGWNVIKRKEALARAAVDEGGFGSYEAKVSKIANRVSGTLNDMRDIKTVGVVEDLPERGIIKIAKPVGVVAALIPTTGPDATPPVKGLAALKGRNAIIVCPHPRTAGTSKAVVEAMREGCRQVGAPEDLIQVVEAPSLAKTQALMAACDLVVATGGAGMVKAAYSSGTPAYGVGVGNSVHVIDETADLEMAANHIASAKTFDHATSCLADNAVVAHGHVYDELVAELAARGGYLCDAAETERLRKLMWPGASHIPILDVIAKPAGHIARMAEIDVPDGTGFLMVEAAGAGPDHPFSGEKLSVVLALYRYDGGIDDAVAWVNAITAYQGLGHTCGIHTRNDDHVMALANGTKTARVLVNMNLNEGAGSPRTGMPYTLSLACGTWGGNITTENVNVRHFLNLTWVARRLRDVAEPVSEEALFGAHWAKYGK